MKVLPKAKTSAANKKSSSNKYGQRSLKNAGFGKVKKKEKLKKRKPKELILQPKRVLKLKGYLKTPADWDRFDKWAEKNALPKIPPEPEPIVRRAKPMYKLKRRIEKLARPSKRSDPSGFCREWIITHTALNYKPSRRLMRLAWPIIRFPKPCREVVPPIPKDVLEYEATVRILELSQPKAVKYPEECKPYTAEVSKSAMTHVTTDRENTLALAKKLVACPELLTEEDREKMFTPFGTRKTALTYKHKAWLDLLSLPPYKNLRYRKDETAENWKKQIEEELEKRGKEAYNQQKAGKSEEKKVVQGNKSKSRGTTPGQSTTSIPSDNKSSAPDEGDAGAGDSEDKQTSEKEKKEEERRKRRQNAWRYAPLPYKDNPFEISQSALKFESSPRLEELAKAKERKDNSRRDPFGVRKGALGATASPAVTALATPKLPREPVQKKPPYKKDKYGRPLIKKPRYGKRLPKPEPYKPRDCPDKKADENESKEEPTETSGTTEPIDPIAYQQSIDPVSFPGDAKVQKKERLKLLLRKKDKQKKS